MLGNIFAALLVTGIVTAAEFARRSGRGTADDGTSDGEPLSL